MAAREVRKTDPIESLKLKTQDGKNQGFSVQKLIVAANQTKLGCKSIIKKNSTCPPKNQEKWVSRTVTLKCGGFELEVDLLTANLCRYSTKIKNLQF